jgi:hypothetical protein
MSSTWMAISVRIASGALTAAQIETQLGRRPDRKVERGEPVSRRSPDTGLHQRAFCTYECPLESGAKPDEHVKWLMEFIGEVKPPMMMFGSQYEIDIRIGFSSSSGQGGFAFLAGELSLLAEVGAQLNVDLYSSSNDDDE